MTCFNPKYGQLMWFWDKEKNKMSAKIHFETRENFYKLNKQFGNINSEQTELITIPCRKCIGCKLDHASELATRCVIESKQWKYNCFITLTYANENLKSKNLIKRDIQLFMKRLRKEEKGIESREYKGNSLNVTNNPAARRVAECRSALTGSLASIAS